MDYFSVQSRTSACIAALTITPCSACVASQHSICGPQPLFPKSPLSNKGAIVNKTCFLMGRWVDERLISSDGVKMNVKMSMFSILYYNKLASQLICSIVESCEYCIICVFLHAFYEQKCPCEISYNFCAVLMDDRRSCILLAALSLCALLMYRCRTHRLVSYSDCTL